MAHVHVHGAGHDHSHSHTHDHAHDHAHSHGHVHGHSHAPASFGTAFAIGTALNVTFVVIEAAFGFGAHSLSLVADAGHNLGDVLGLVLAWVAATLARRTPTKHRTYGMRRSSILAALANAILLLVTVGGIGVEAVGRLLHPEAVHGMTVIWVAAAGIVINGVTASLFMSGQHDLNVRAAFAHFLADAVVSAGVVVAGIVILFTAWEWVDPAVSLVLAVVIVVGTWRLLTQSVNLAMDAVPESVDPHAVEAYLSTLDGVTEVHDLHIWGMSTTEVALTAHIVKPGSADGNDDALLLGACKELHDRFGIEHSTIQIERGRGPHDCRHAAVGAL